MTHFLFFSRLALYLLAFSLPIIHPAIAVPYDRVSLTFWFALVPVEMLIAYFLSPPRLRYRGWLLAGAAPILLFVLFMAGFELATLLYTAGAAAAFLLTVLVFKTGGYGQSFAVVEQFILGIVAYRILSFSRSSEALARQASGITQMILVLIPAAFLLHGVLLYLSAFRKKGDRRGVRELALFLLLAVPAFLALSFLLPPNFVSHAFVLNRVDKDIKPKPVPLDDEGRGWPGGNLKSREGRQREGLREGENGNGSETGEEPGQAGRNSLEGLPADQWGNASMGEGGDAKQYAVMVVASPVEPVYAADSYSGDFDPERGFLRSRDEPLNELAYLRFLETWRDPQPGSDLKRYPYDVYYLSTLPERYLAYRPSAIEPTVLKREYYPFEYSYRTVSRISQAAPEDWSSIESLGGLRPEERAALKLFLDIPLPDSARAAFTEHLNRALSAVSAQNKPGAGSYYARIEAILKSFSPFQYELGFTEDTSVAKMEDFLQRTKRGDCTEFSNSAAILLRLAGIPSRVVTGYLAAANLQSFAHWQAIRVLRQAIKPLQEFPLDELYLVTTAQRHSWTQAFLPGYGWVDLESTAFAIPPPPGKNPGDLDVVIPLIQPQPQERPSFRFPWLLTLQGLAALAFLSLAGLYLYRYIRQAVLTLLSRGRSPRALRALYTLLLLKLTGRDYELKRRYQTPLEYAQRYPELTRFASLYTQLRYRERAAPEEQEAAWRALRESYEELLKDSLRPGLWPTLKRLFSLKGLYYL